ncbi:DUF4030 domain-containing protein [Peribacillus simplex]|uniref:DUF4030 domain-containing protein n=2 Tax=Peribacillus TaxID=2675229 RepID=A0AA90PF76_9BACI|nr:MULTISPECIES: DUF4030 domain-containing protein [Peribacillus]MDP1420375.1 DUF4030 domain-containing protein [Peribacillus simplex]MDP1453456.1 DUF4030 domain-containing protein [Peribacillus frigoritolerans]
MDFKIKKEIEKIEIPNELHDFVKLGIIQAKEETKTLVPSFEKKPVKKRWSQKKKFTYLTLASIMMVGLFISTAFISPAMATIASQIPYLNQIFHSDSILDSVSQIIDEEGIQVSSSGVRYLPKKEVYIVLDGPIEYYNDTKEELELKIKELLAAKDFDAYSINISQEESYVSKQKEKNEIETLYNKLEDNFNKLGYQAINISIDPSEEAILINLNSSEKNYKQAQNEIEKEARKITNNSSTYKNYDIKIANTKVEVIKAGKGAEIAPILEEGLLSKKEFKVTSIGYTTNSLTFSIYTSIDSTDSKSRESIKTLKNTINEFLQSEEIKTIVEGEPVTIKIFNKDNKIIK